MALSIGSKAPDFTLASTSGKRFTLSQEMMHKPCVLYFYPMDFSVGCTNEACSFRDTFEIFLELDVRVIGISRDSIESHLRFKKTLGLPFDLLSDPDGAVCANYKTQLPLVPSFTKRTTYLLDRNQFILAAYENIFSSRRHIKTMIEQIAPVKKPLPATGKFQFQNA